MRPSRNLLKVSMQLGYQRVVAAGAHWRRMHETWKEVQKTNEEPVCYSDYFAFLSRLSHCVADLFDSRVLPYCSSFAGVAEPCLQR